MNNVSLLNLLIPVISLDDSDASGSVIVADAGNADRETQADEDGQKEEEQMQEEEKDPCKAIVDKASG